jgi:hypothetical protein
MFNLLNDSIVRWRKEDLPVRYFIDEAGAPNCADEFEAIKRAHQTWEDESRSFINFSYDGTITNKMPGLNDSINVCYWYRQNFPFSRNVIAVCYVWWSTDDGHILDCDIAYNGEHFSWSTNGEPDKMDVENITCHEVGHNLLLLDLYRRADSAKTMYGYVSRGEINKRTLDEDDKNGAAYLYPNTNITWSRLANMPRGTNGKRVRNGGSLTAARNSIFALKGNSTNEFYRYLPDSNYWQDLPPLPFVGRSRKKIKAGGALCFDGEGTIYAIKGGKSLEFWSYSIEKEVWNQKPDVPLNGKKKLGGGASLICVETNKSPNIYLLRGNRTLDFYVYSDETNSWSAKASVPLGPKERGMGSGSSLVYDDQKYIYALKSGTNEFYAYDIFADSWIVRNPFPVNDYKGRRRSVRNGACLAADGQGMIFALRGGRSHDFFFYDCGSNTWTYLSPIPNSSTKKKGTRGAGLTILNGKVYLLRGNNTFEFWEATIGGMVNSSQESTYENYYCKTDKNETLIIKPFSVIPNPFTQKLNIKFNYEAKPSKRTLRIYDSAGILVRSFRPEHSLIWDGKNQFGEDCAPGVYWIQIIDRNFRISQKAIKLQ